MQVFSVNLIHLFEYTNIHDKFELLILPSKNYDLFHSIDIYSFEFPYFVVFGIEKKEIITQPIKMYYFCN
jgi:hypothetical protein